MPFGDGTGPMGMGPMSGRTAGYCAGYGMPGYMNCFCGRGFGFGRGHRRWFYATGLTGWQRAGMFYPPHVSPPPYGTPWTKEQEMDYLQAQAESMQKALEEIRKRLADLSEEVNKK